MGPRERRRQAGCRGPRRFKKMTALVYVVLVLSAVVFVAATVARAVMYARMPLHLRWELYPVPHEAPDRAMRERGACKIACNIRDQIAPILIRECFIQFLAPRIYEVVTQALKISPHTPGFRIGCHLIRETRVAKFFFIKRDPLMAPHEKHNTNVLACDERGYHIGAQKIFCFHPRNY